MTSPVCMSSCTEGHPVSPLPVPLKRSRRAMVGAFRREVISQASPGTTSGVSGFAALREKHDATFRARQETSGNSPGDGECAVPNVLFMATNELQDVDPYTAMESLREALHEADRIVFPSLSVDHASPDLKLVVLGSVRADVAMRLAEALRRGGREQ